MSASRCPLRVLRVAGYINSYNTKYMGHAMNVETTVRPAFKTPRRARSTTARAAVLCVVACAFFAGANALAKAAQTALPGPDLHPAEVAAARFLFAFLAIAPFILRRGVAAYRTAMPLRHVQRVLLGFAGVTCIFAAVRAIPLGDVTAIAWAAPIFTLVFAAAFLGERVRATRWTAACVGFAGVLVVMRPSAAAFEPAALLALLAAVCVGAEVATIRLLASRDPTLTVLAINNTLGAVIAVLVAAPFAVLPSGPQLLALAGVGVVMVTGQAILLKALAIAEASAVAPFYYATIAWAAAYGALFFDEAIGWRFLAGAALIAAGGAVVAMRTAR